MQEVRYDDCNCELMPNNNKLQTLWNETKKIRLQWLSINISKQMATKTSILIYTYSNSLLFACTQSFTGTERIYFTNHVKGMNNPSRLCQNIFFYLFIFWKILRKLIFQKICFGQFWANMPICSQFGPQNTSNIYLKLIKWRLLFGDILRPPSLSLQIVYLQTRSFWWPSFKTRKRKS